jgi:GNAT superfamily N-acetyltransferase
MSSTAPTQRPELRPQLRPLAAADLERVVALDAALGGHSRRAYFERRLGAALRDPEHHLQYAADDAWDLGGFALARVLAGEFGRDRPALMLEVIGVSFQHRGRGIGALLLRELESEAARRGVRELWTQASWRQERMLRFLARSGFELAPPPVLGCAAPALARGEHAEAARDRYEVRTLAASDLEDILRIDRHLLGRERRDYMQLRLGEAMGDTAVRVSLVARCEDSIAGYAMARMDFGDFGRAEPVAVLDTIGVDPGFARRGVGAALLSQLAVNLAALGIERIETTVAHDDFELLGFLYRAGFSRSPRLAFVKRLES